MHLVKISIGTTIIPSERSEVLGSMPEGTRATKESVHLELLELKEE